MVSFKPLVLTQRRPLTLKLAVLLFGAVEVLAAAELIAGQLAMSSVPIVLLIFGVATVLVVFTGPVLVVAISAWYGRRWARVGAIVLSAVALLMAATLVPGFVAAAALVIGATVLLWQKDARDYARATWEARRGSSNP